MQITSSHIAALFVQLLTASFFSDSQCKLNTFVNGLQLCRFVDGKYFFVHTKQDENQMN